MADISSADTGAGVIIVITDANVLINFLRIEQLALLAALKGYRFLVPEEVLREITEPNQHSAVNVAINKGLLSNAFEHTVESLDLFAKLRDFMGRGEAACLALAATTGCYIASDERKKFYRIALTHLGEARILRTEAIIVQAIIQGLVSVAEADGFKATLAANRYLIPFESFADLLTQGNVGM